LEYDHPAVILERLLKAEVGDAEFRDLDNVQSGTVQEFLELREIIG